MRLAYLYRRHAKAHLYQVYGEVKTGQGDLKEHSLLEPTNPYAATKAAAEMMVTAYAKSFKLPTVIIRLNNIYGPHQVSSVRS